ncbi:HD-GYP domain, c-di-GMP phosphodiesterase class II (or its inactivated variant) [Natronincola peptidivorans]|uniref:HD-GYP domain, c-di-GMP phosphodiesterase class II (Or its inactivated variant) n=1 Tax=Natronincola peptidivorans TaxID=426128 RepID=A0A1I0AIN0_9FIRM|nr:HD-GYP domain-containing protein [Natronincola peptidivorans]SES94164.1 HD-GYP domain, c-di-GMP phosphodiesterase class II (or its inactivated variant) [Natronincola peptidivorans]
MRVIDLYHATEDHILALPIFNENGKILLSNGVSLRPSLIARLIDMGYSRVYIKDEYSQQDIEDIIKPEVRQKAIGHVRRLASIVREEGKNPNSTSSEFTKDLNMAKATISTIVDEIFAKNDIVLELLDLKTVEGYIYEHSINVMIHSLVLGTTLGLNKQDLDKLALAAALHDIGMMFVPEDILKKRSPLTEKEFKEIETHAVKGYEFLKTKQDINPTIRIPALQHHKRYDNSGYPDTVDYKDTHLFSRIIAVADTFDAMTSHRPYRKAEPVSEVLEYIMGSGGTLFHPTLTKAFILNINPYPVNTLVKLSDGSIGVVVKVNGRFFSRPVIRLIIDKDRKNTSNTVDLLENKTLVIKEMISSI